MIVLTPSASAPTVPRNPPLADVEEKLAVKGKSNLTWQCNWFNKVGNNHNITDAVDLLA